MRLFCLPILFLLLGVMPIKADEAINATPELSPRAQKVLRGKQLLYIERLQYLKDHHNTATIFQKGEINEDSFGPIVGATMKIYDFDTKTTRVLIEATEGIVRDPEMSFDGQKVIFSMRKNFDDDYHIYEINVDGSGLKQLTWAKGVSDIDPLYLPDGGIVFSSTRQPKYCMCNRHIMANLFRMDGDGANITQIGVSTLFEGHSTLLPDGRILYDRWEYVDRNFADAQALWTVNPDGTKHSIYYGNNTAAPDGVIDARAIPGTDLIACIFGSCHDRPWGSLVILDRKKGVDGAEPVVHIWPKESRELIGKDPNRTDVFRNEGLLSYEDPFPIDETYILAARTISQTYAKGEVTGKTAIYLIGTDGVEEKIIEGEKDLFDPIIVGPQFKPNVIPSMRNYEDETGSFYVQNVYEGTHMQGVEKGTVKYLRVVESLNKLTYTAAAWVGQGQLAPGVSWHNFDIKRIVSEVEVEEDGSANFEAPAGIHLYFQLLDKDKKMIQTMRSGVSLMPGETNGCIGCHEDRLAIPTPSAGMLAFKRPKSKINGWQGNVNTRALGFMEDVQPILDRNCVSCHDFDAENRSKLVLAGDKNPFFNAAYVNLYVNKVVTLIGGGPVEFQAPYAWGSYPSKLTKIIEGNHNDVKLTDLEKQTLYAWMDLNGGYYPVYESAFDTTHAGRSPLENKEAAELAELTGLDFKVLSSFRRTSPATISFDRPELSPCLDVIRDDKAKYDRAVEILKIGAQRLKETPRGDIESELVMCERHKEQMSRYVERMTGEDQNSCFIDVSTKRYDSR